MRLTRLRQQGAFPLPHGPGKSWLRIVDTASWAEPFCNCWRPRDTAETIVGDYRVHPFSIVVLEETLR